MEAVQSTMKTRLGIFDAVCFDDGRESPPVAFAFGDYKRRTPLVRIQSECLPGLVFGSLTCDCAGQRDDAMQAIVDDGSGILIHLWQEGRGIGLADKMRAYGKQMLEGLDTVDANIAIGRAVDERDYSDVKEILGWFDASKIRMLTNNPSKVEAIRAMGIEVSEIVRIPPKVNPLNLNYIRTKAVRLGHLYDTSDLQG